MHYHKLTFYYRRNSRHFVRCSGIYNWLTGLLREILYQCLHMWYFVANTYVGKMAITKWQIIPAVHTTKQLPQLQCKNLTCWDIAKEWAHFSKYHFFRFLLNYTWSPIPAMSACWLDNGRCSLWRHGHDQRLLSILCKSLHYSFSTKFCRENIKQAQSVTRPTTLWK